MIAPPGHRLRLGLADIGLLDEVSFATVDPAPGARQLTVALWLCAERLGAMQVVASVSNRSTALAGWTVYLAEGDVVFRCKEEARPCVEAAAALADDGQWHHLAATADLDAARIELCIDGAASPAHRRPPAELVDPAAVSADPRLVVGGYTDDAGGHFDHRFGREGSGLVDDLRVYDRCLGRAEIAALASAGRGARAGAGARRAALTIRAVPAGGTAPLTVRLAANPLPADTTICIWDLGDGTRSLARAPSHRYAYAGRYAVTLRAIGRDHVETRAAGSVTLRGRADPLRIAPVFVNGTEGHACYRIPAVVEARDGRLVAFAEGRVQDCSDATAAIRIVSKRSEDGGATWGSLTVVARNLVDGEERACMNPSPVVDAVRGTGRIVVVFNKQEHSEWAVAGGLGVNRVFCAWSDDHGVTWREREITGEVHRPFSPRHAALCAAAADRRNQGADWRKQVPTLGHAIQLTGGEGGGATLGRLLYVGGRTEGDDAVFETRNYAFWSDDLGASWQVGPAIERREDGTSAKGLGEASAAELADGSILVNSRNYRDCRVVGLRAVTRGAFDAEGALSFGPAREDQALVESGVQASVLRLRQARCAAGDWILFSNPAHPEARRRLTVRLSRDGGRTWPVATAIDPGPAAYSDLVERADGTIGVLYERGNTGGIAFATLPLDLLA